MPTPLFQDWFYSPDAPEARAERDGTLFCFPFAGAGPSNFHALCKAFSGSLAPFVARLPGREARRHITALTDVHSIARALAAAIAPVAAERPAIFWGHSMGALVAFELARMLPAASRPRLLVVSGHKAPQIPRVRRSVRIEDLSDEEFIDLVKAYGGTPAAVFANRELLDIFLPQLRADLTALENYRFAPGPRLDCDILCLNGTTDHLVGAVEAAAWEQQTTGAFAARTISGGHFFLNESRAATVHAVLRASLAATAAEPVRRQALC